MYYNLSMGLSDNGKIEEVLLKLNSSPFRSRFHLSAQDRGYVKSKGMEVIRSHAVKFIEERIAGANLQRDGKQTPMRGHPVFIAQHATATCCRGCIAKWHKIPATGALGNEQVQYLADVIMAWITVQMGDNL